MCCGGADTAEVKGAVEALCSIPYELRLKLPKVDSFHRAMQNTRPPTCCLQLSNTFMLSYLQYYAANSRSPQANLAKILICTSVAGEGVFPEPIHQITGIGQTYTLTRESGLFHFIPVKLPRVCKVTEYHGGEWSQPGHFRTSTISKRF